MRKNINAFWAVGYVFIFLAIQIIATMLVTLVEQVVHLHDSSIGQGLSPMGTIVAMVIFSLTAILLFTLLRWAPLTKAYAQSRPWGVLAWSAVGALGAIIPSMWVQGFMPDWPELIQRYVEQAEAEATLIANTRGGYFVICLLAPVAEEVVFRGAVLHTLLQWQPHRRWAMIALSALLFALAHLNPAQLLHPFAIGLLLGWMYERTGSILPGIVYHWVNNTVAYLLMHAYPDPKITLNDVFGSTSHVLLAVVFSLLILMPAFYQLNLRMKKPELQ